MAARRGHVSLRRDGSLRPRQTRPRARQPRPADGEGFPRDHQPQRRAPSGATSCGEGFHREQRTIGMSERPRPSGQRQPDRQQAGSKRVSSETRHRAYGQAPSGVWPSDRPRRARAFGPRQLAAASPATALGQPTGRQAKASPSGPARARTHLATLTDANSVHPSGRSEAAPESRPVPARPSGHKGASQPASPRATFGSQRGQPTANPRSGKGMTHR